MSTDAKVIWRKGDGAMPSKAEYVSLAAQSELLLRSLCLSEDAVNHIKYNSEKNNQSVPEYISSVLARELEIA